MPTAGSHNALTTDASRLQATPRAAAWHLPRCRSCATKIPLCRQLSWRLSPWTDLALTGASLQSNAEADPMMSVDAMPNFVTHYLAGADPMHPYASPLHGDMSGLPPALIQVGSDEILRDDGVRMAEKLRSAGCDSEIEIWPRMPHCWQLYARILPEARIAIEHIGMFLDRTL